VTISFTNLEVSEIGATVNGFGGPGDNQVVVGDLIVFNGQFLTALGFSLSIFRSPGFVRTIHLIKKLPT
jgi:hypothetical protein